MNINKYKTMTAKKTVMVSMRLTPELYKWLKKEGLSITGIFNEAVSALGYKINTSEVKQ